MFLKDQSLPWPTVFFDHEGLKAFQNPLAFWFNVKGIPAMFLIDREGRFAGLRDAELEERVQSLLAAEAGAVASGLTIEKQSEPASAGSPENVRRSRTKPSQPNSNRQPTSMAEAAVSLIKRHDQNQDGVLDSSEWARSGTDYGKFDLDADGRLTSDEMSTAIGLARMNATLSKRKKSP